MDNEPSRRVESLDDLLVNKYVNVEVMLNAVKGDGKDGTVLYSGTYAGRARLGSMDFLVLKDADYYTPANIVWTDTVNNVNTKSTKLASKNIYVALDRVISIAENRISQT